MKSTIKNIEAGIAKIPIKIFIFGNNGVGKSYFASKFPTPVFVNVEDNINHLNVSRFSSRSLWKTIEFVKSLIEDKHNYKTIVIDTISKLEMFGKSEACKAVGVRDIYSHYNRGASQLTLMMEMLRCELERLLYKRNMNIVLLSHCKESEISPIDGAPYHQIVPAMLYTTASVFTSWCSIVAYVKLSYKNLNSSNSRLNNNVEMGRTLEFGSLRYKDVKNVYSLEDTKNITLSAENLFSMIHKFYDTKEIKTAKADIKKIKNAKADVS